MNDDLQKLIAITGRVKVQPEDWHEVEHLVSIGLLSDISNHFAGGQRGVMRTAAGDFVVENCSIEPYVHRCMVRDGPAAGNKVATEISSWDIQKGYYDEKNCENCGMPLAPLDEVTAHIYEQLTGL